MKGFLNLDARLDKEVKEVFQNDLKGISNVEKGVRKFFRIHPWTSKKYGRKEMATKVIQGIGIVIVTIITLKILNFI